MLFFWSLLPSRVFIFGSQQINGWAVNLCRFRLLNISCPSWFIIYFFLMPVEGQENSSFSMNPFYGHYLGSQVKRIRKGSTKDIAPQLSSHQMRGNNSSDFRSPFHWANKETQIQFPKLPEGNGIRGEYIIRPRAAFGAAGLMISARLLALRLMAIAWHSALSLRGWGRSWESAEKIPGPWHTQ